MANHWQDAATEARTSHTRIESARLTAERNASRYTLPVR